MSNYIIQCMPYMKQHTDESNREVTTDNVFNCKETTWITKKRYIQ